MHKVGARQELVCRDHTVQVLALDTHEPRQACSRADEYGIETLLLHQRIDGHGAAHYDVGLEPDAQLAQRTDLTRHDLILRKAELRYAVYQHAAQLVQRLEYRNLIPHLGQIARTGKARGAAAHDGDTVPVRRGAASAATAMRKVPVTDITLQLAYGHGFALYTQHARSLALRLLRADTPADARQRAVRRYDLGRSGDVALGHLGDESRYVYIDGAGLYTSRALARKAARRLETSLLVVVSVADLFEICGTDGRILLAYRHARNLICHSTRIYVSR